MESMTQGEVESNAIAVTRVADQAGPGTLAMALMSEAEFGTRLAALKRGQARISQIKRELMQDGSHYGTIPGTKKPTLLKPGAEVLCSIYGLRPDFLPQVQYSDGSAAPTITVTMRCELHLGDTSGPVVAVGYGAANSWEARYRFRQGQRACPKCGVVGSVIKGKAEYGGGWLCWPKAKAAAGCGAKFAENDPAITEQAVGQVENDNPYDLLNTLVKMAKKRAHIDAALTGTASSDLFTQDLEDLGPRGGRHDEPPMDDDGSRDEGRAETTRAPRPARASGPKPSGLADRIVSFARSRNLPSAKAAEVLKSLGFASSKDVPEDKARAVFEALEAAAPKREPGSDDDDPFGKLHEDAIPENVGPQR